MHLNKSFISSYVFVCYLLAVTPLLVADYFPVIDFYDHISRYFILANYDAIPSLRDHYIHQWGLLPNIGLDTLSLPFFSLFPPLQTGKALLGMITLIMYFGILTLGIRLKASLLVLAPAAAMLTHSFIFTWGFINFLFGISLSCYVLSRMLDENLEYSPRNYGLQVLAAVALFFIHGLAFFFFGVLAFLLISAPYLRDFPHLNKRYFRDIFWLLGLAVIPAVLFILSQTSETGGALGLGLDKIAAKYGEPDALIKRLLWEAQLRIEHIFRVVESGYIQLDIALNAVLMLIFAWSIATGRLIVRGEFLPALICLSLLYVFMPPNLFSAGHVAERIPLLLAIVLSISLALAPDRKLIPAISLAVALLVQTTFMSIYWWQSSQQYARFVEDVSTLEQDTTIVTLVGYKTSRRDDNFPRCKPLSHLAFLTNRMHTNIFSRQDQQPLALKKRLNSILEKNKAIVYDKYQPSRETFQTHFNVLASGDYDYVVVCGEKWMDLTYPDHARVVAVTDYYKIFEILPHRTTVPTVPSPGIP